MIIIAQNPVFKHRKVWQSLHFTTIRCVTEEQIEWKSIKKQAEYNTAPPFFYVAQFDT